MSKAYFIDFIAILLAIFIAFGFPYLMVSFAIWEYPINFADWNLRTRCQYIVSNMLCTILSFIFLLSYFTIIRDNIKYMIEENKKIGGESE